MTDDPGPGSRADPNGALHSRIHVFAGAGRAEVLSRARGGRQATVGSVRLVIVADPPTLAGQVAVAATYFGRRANAPVGVVRIADGVYFCEHPCTGDVAFVYTATGADYPGAGRSLAAAFPDVVAELVARDPATADRFWTQPAADAKAPRSPWQQMTATIQLSALHTRFLLRVLGLEPTAVVGLSVGEISALLSMEVWTDPAASRADLVESGLFDHLVVAPFDVLRRTWAEPDPQWQTWRILGSVDEIARHVALEPKVRLMVIHADDDALIGGDPEGCSRVLGAIGRDRAFRLDMDMAIHSPEAGTVAELWRAVFSRNTNPTHVRFYSGSQAAPYEPTMVGCAEALVDMVSQTVDFRAVVERAYADGVRTFVEMGPRDLCAGWIKKILGRREHVVMAMDSYGVDSLDQARNVVAQLSAAGLVGTLEEIGHDPDPPRRRPVVTTGASAAFDPVEPPVRPLGPALDRRQLEALAAGDVAAAFGAGHALADPSLRHLPLPGPPLLMIDRVLGIDAVLLSRGAGTIWTQTEVRADSWFVHDGRATLSAMFEGGQGLQQLLLWLGFDRGSSDRVYRLLDGEVEFDGPLAEPGDVLTYEIRLAQPLNLGQITICPFEVDCYVGSQLRLRVRRGRGGLFPPAQLRHAAGLPAGSDRPDVRRIDPPRVLTSRTAFSRIHVEHFAQGDVAACFGPGFEFGQTHVRSPSISSGRLLQIDRVEQVSIDGGWWGSGFLRAQKTIRPTDWYFESNFPSDPVMPGLLVLEGAVQALSFYLAAMGFTLNRDGFRFEPRCTEACVLQMRSQITSANRELVFEVNVQELRGGAEPLVRADVLVTVDGVNAGVCRGLAVRLVRDFPLSTMRGAIRDDDLRPAARLALPSVEGAVDRYLNLDYASLIAAAWGSPTDAYGPAYHEFDVSRQGPRMPGPPFHFVSRIASFDAEFGVIRPGMSAVSEFDIDCDAWYFQDNGTDEMPFAVLLEAALQSAGWLCTFGGVILHSAKDLSCRNLEGTATAVRPVRRTDGCLEMRTTLVSASQLGSTHVLSLDVECSVAGEVVCSLTTVSGFFPDVSVSGSVMTVDQAESDLLKLASPTALELDGPELPYRGGIGLPTGRLRMLSRITGWWPAGGTHQLGAVRAEKDVRESDWYFKAHFLQDPVQPGSLGLEAMLQILRFVLLESGAAEGMRTPQFREFVPDRPLTWSYRGQVLPMTGSVTLLIDVVELISTPGHCTIVADGSLWLDERKIYRATGLSAEVFDSSETS